MAELFFAAAILAGTSVALGAGMRYGTRYIDQQLDISPALISSREPLVRPIPSEPPQVIARSES